MKKLIYTATIIVIHHLTFNIQHSFAQIANDKIGSGNGLDFDGTNDYVFCGDINTNQFDNSATQLSAEAWINMGNLNGDHAVMGKYNNNNSDRVFLLRIRDGGEIAFTIGKASNLDVRTYTTTNEVINAGEWMHLAVVADLPSQELKIYLNGEEMPGSTSSVGAWPTVIEDGNSDFEIGIHRSIDSMGNPSEHFDGQIDEVRLWNIALSESQIRDNMCEKLTGNETGLVGYWRMNEGTGSTVTDLTANSNNGTLQ